MNKTVRIMSSNTLGNCGQLLIANRDDMLADVYLEYAPDVIALQEVSTKLRREETNLFTLIEPDYREIDVLTTNRSHNNGTPLAYNTKKLDVVDKGYLFYIDGYCDNSKSACWAVFALRDGGRRFAVVSTHFIHVADDGRVKDAEQLKLLCDAIAHKYGIPVFVCGDFNANVEAESYKTLIESGFTDLRDIADEASALCSFHPYPEWDEEKCVFTPGKQPEGDFRRSIDHVFAYGEVKPAVARYAIINDERSRTGSDHFPLFVDVTI